MRKVSRALFAVALVLPVGLAASASGAAAGMSCSSEAATITFSPALPAFGDPTTVVPTITGTETWSGCVGLGVTSGTATFTTTLSTPLNCDLLPTHFGWSGALPMTWNTGQTSTLTGFFPITVDTVTSGLFQGSAIANGLFGSFTTPGWCTSPTATLAFAWNAPHTLTLPFASVTCFDPRSCNTTQSASATATATGLTVAVSGTPAVGAGTIDLTITSGTLKCPNVTPTIVPIADFTDTGFKPTDRLSVTATLPLTSATTAEQVCFHSTVPFRSQSNPTVAKAGTALLLGCTKVKNVAPCVLSSKQVGSDVVVRFVAPGGDPRFCLVLPTGRQVWFRNTGTGKVGTRYAAHLQSSGGKSPIRWKITSGKLPTGLALNTNTGAITGKPTTRGHFTFVVQATDSENPPQTAKIALPIVIK
jgi:hypothetical protein